MQFTFMLDAAFDDATLPDTPENRRRIANLVTEISAIEASGYSVRFDVS